MSMPDISEALVKACFLSFTEGAKPDSRIYAYVLLCFLMAMALLQPIGFCKHVC